MHNRDDSRTDLGLIRIHRNVIASIASLAATEVEGVKSIGISAKGILALAFLNKDVLSRIKVEIDKNQEVKVQIPLVIKYGYNIPDVANRVQENISRALDKMTSLSVKDINVVVQGVEK